MTKAAEYFEIMSTFMPDDNDKTIHGIDKLNLMLRFMKVLDGKRPKQDYVRFKSWLVQTLKRGLTPQEDLNLATGIYNYVKSDQATPERMNAMNYLFDAKFLDK